MSSPQKILKSLIASEAFINSIVRGYFHQNTPSLVDTVVLEDVIATIISTKKALGLIAEFTEIDKKIWSCALYVLTLLLVSKKINIPTIEIVLLLNNEDIVTLLYETAYSELFVEK